MTPAAPMLESYVVIEEINRNYSHEPLMITVDDAASDAVITPALHQVNSDTLAVDEVASAAVVMHALH